MSVAIEIGDEFVWQENYKEVEEGDTILITNIYVDEDGVPQIRILNYCDETMSLTASDIQEKWEDGLILKEE